MDNDFLNWLKIWKSNLKTASWEDYGKNSEKTAIICVDMVVGFCHKGSLASKSVKNIIPNVVDVLKKANSYGVGKFILVQDAHHHEATEFSAFPPHCVKGSDEAETIPELRALPFAKNFTTVEKNSLSPAYETKFDAIIDSHPNLNTFIIVGDCTDLCVYSMAMHLRLKANSQNKMRRIIVPANAVATYDLSVENAKKINALPHPENLLHLLFLYHMLLNAVEIVKEIK